MKKNIPISKLPMILKFYYLLSKIFRTTPCPSVSTKQSVFCNSLVVLAAQCLFIEIIKQLTLSATEWEKEINTTLNGVVLNWKHWNDSWTLHRVWSRGIKIPLPMWKSLTPHLKNCCSILTAPFTFATKWLTIEHCFLLQLLQCLKEEVQGFHILRKN